MQKIWQLQEAKNKLSEVIERALNEGPQVITRRGRRTAVILSAKEYDKLHQPHNNLIDFFKNSPMYGVNLEIERVKDYSRDVML